MNKILCDSNKQIRFKKQIILQTNRLTIISVVEMQPKMIKKYSFCDSNKQNSTLKNKKISFVEIQDKMI